MDWMELDPQHRILHHHAIYPDSFTRRGQTSVTLSTAVEGGGTE